MREAQRSNKRWNMECILRHQRDKQYNWGDLFVSNMNHLTNIHTKVQILNWPLAVPPYLLNPSEFPNPTSRMKSCLCSRRITPPTKTTPRTPIHRPLYHLTQTTRRINQRPTKPPILKREERVRLRSPIRTRQIICVYHLLRSRRTMSVH